MTCGVPDVDAATAKEQHVEEADETVDDTTDFDMSLNDIRVLQQGKYELFLAMENAE